VPLLIFLGVAGLALLTFFATSAQGVSMTRYNRKQLETIVNRAAQSAGIGANYVRAIVTIESAWRATAVNPADPSYGLMQLTPSTARGFGWTGTDPKDQDTGLLNPTINAQVGARFLAFLFQKYSGRFPAEWVQMYNLGETKFLNGVRVPSYQARFEEALMRREAVINSG